MRYLLSLCLLGSVLNGCLRTSDDLKSEDIDDSSDCLMISNSAYECLLGGEELTTIEDPRIGITWVNLPAGSFMMGSEHLPSEKPIRQVTVQAFQMSETEVTVGQYRQCVEAGRCSEPNRCNWSSSPSDKEDYPINCVDWGQARTFAVWAGGDLPTEAQWEYAAKGGEGYEYAGSDNVDEVAWYFGNSQGSIQLVKTKRANGYGLYDMSGNVSEWTLDEWHDNYRGAPSTAETPWGDVNECSQVCSGGSSRRVSRGGGWTSDPSVLRVVNRQDRNAFDRNSRHGFRVRRTLP